MTLWPIVATAASAFLASLVECIEALTVVLAVGAVRGWRAALMGVGAGLFILVAAVFVLGPALHHVPLAWLRAPLGALLLLFGLRWLRKAVLRAAGIIPPHDEAELFEREMSRLGGLADAKGWDWAGFSTCCGITLLEGSEIVFIVIALGTGVSNQFDAAGLAALMAFLVVLLVGVIVHRPLTSIPKNKLKLPVGVMLSAFGTFWFAEGASWTWPGDDWALPALILVYLTLALLLAAVCRRGRAAVVTV